MADFVQILTEAFKDAGLDGVRCYTTNAGIAMEELHLVGLWTDKQVYVKLHVGVRGPGRVAIWFRLDRPTFSNETPDVEFEPIDRVFVDDHATNLTAVDQVVNRVVREMTKFSAQIRCHKAEKLDRLAEELDQSARDEDGGDRG